MIRALSVLVTGAGVGRQLGLVRGRDRHLLTPPLTELGACRTPWHSPAQPGTARQSAPQNTGGGAELSGQLLSPQEEGRERMRWGPSSPFMGSSYLTPSKNREILCAGEEQNAILINFLHKNADVHRTALCWLRRCYEL